MLLHQQARQSHLTGDSSVLKYASVRFLCYHKEAGNTYNLLTVIDCF